MKRTKRILLLVPAILMSALLWAQQTRTLTGKVMDEIGQPLAGAGVMLPDGMRGTVTDAEGAYSIRLTEADELLSFSFLGYETMNVNVKGKSSVDVILIPDNANTLNDVVVIGYGAAKKQDLTGSVSVVKMSVIEDLPVTSVDQALQGRIAGVDIVSSGAPGGASSINIRGARSITASNEPLIVVDGVSDAVSDLSEIDPVDIESISVMKDASSTAIYGSRGANGVILITTKKGKSPKPSVTFKTEFGISQIARTLDVMGTEEFIRYRNDIRQIDRLASTPDALPYYDAADFANDTDWINAITRPAMYQHYYLSVSGRQKGTGYFGALSWNDEQGIIKGSGARRFSGRLNLSHDFTRWLSVNLNMSMSYNNRDVNKAQFGGTNISNGAMYLAPVIGLLDRNNPIYENGALINTPYSSILYEEYYCVTPAQNYSLSVVLKPVKGLEIKSQNSFNMFTSNTYHWWPSYMPKKADGEGADAYRFTRDNKKLGTENTISYRNKFSSGHSFDALAGFSASSASYLQQSIKAAGMLDDNAKWNNFAAIGSKENYTIASSPSRITRMSAFARVGYNYKSRYYLNASLRADGSSNFARNNKWGLFPSAAVKWSVKNEKFMRTARWLNTFDIRGSYGRTGNDDIPAFRSLQSYATTSTYVFDGAQAPAFSLLRLENPDLTWETTDMANAAVELSMFNRRLTVALEGYWSWTRDLLLDVTTMRTTGYASRLSNLGLTSNDGFELSVQSVNIERPKFGWNTAFTISHNRQRVLDVGHNDYVPTVKSPGNINYMMYGYMAGYPLNSLWGFEYGGTVKNIQEFADNLESRRYGYRENLSADNCLGHSRYVDQNHDGVLDQKDLVYLGNGDPVVSGGLQNEFYFGNFRLSFFIAYSIGGKIYNYSELYMGGSMYSNQYRYMLNSWHPLRNPDSDIPRAGDTSNAMLPSSLQVHDASYIRLKDLSLKYTFPLYKKSNVFKSLSLTLSGTNLLLWAPYNGFDPDVTSEVDSGTLRRVDMNAYPSARKVVFSVQLTL